MAASDQVSEKKSKENKPSEPEKTGVLSTGDVTRTKPENLNNELIAAPSAQQLESQKAATAVDKKAADKLIEDGEIPRVGIDLNIKAVTSDQIRFSELYQGRLSKLDNLILVTPKSGKNEGESDEQYAQRQSKILLDKQKAIQDEMSKHVWGKESQLAFENYVNWVQTKSIPFATNRLASLGIQGPAGNPLEKPPGMDNQEYLDNVASGKLKLDLQIDAKKIPTAQEAQKLEDALGWTFKTYRAVQNNVLALEDKQLAETINNSGFPKGWLYKEGQDPAAYRNSANDMIDLYTRIGRAIRVVDSLHMPIELPPGTSYTRGKNGEIQNLVLAMPQTLKQEDATNVSLIAHSREWLEQSTDKIAQATKDKSIPAVAYSDTVIPQIKDAKGNKIDAQARFDRNGNLIDIIDPTKVKLEAGQTAIDANLLEERGSAYQAANGDIVVKQSIQAQYAPFYSPQNWIYSNVGKPMELKDDKGNVIAERHFKPDELVQVRNGASSEYILAKDLPNWTNTQAFLFHGEKVLNAGMDIAMLATGSIEIMAAVKGAQALIAAAEIGTAVARVGGSRLAFTGSKGVMDLTLGLTDPLSNAYWVSHDGGQAASIRGKVFLASMGWGLAEAGAARFSSSFAKSQAEGARSIDELIAGSGSKIQKIDQSAKSALTWAQVPMAPLVSGGVLEQLKQIYRPMDPNAGEASLADFKDGKGQQKSIPEKPGIHLPIDSAQENKILANHKVVLESNLPDTRQGQSTKAQIEALFGEAARLNTLAADKFFDQSKLSEEKAIFMQKLAANLSFSDFEISDLEHTNNAQLSNQEIHDLIDPDKRKLFLNRNVSDLASTYMDAKDKDIARASQILLLSLSRSADGKPAAVATSISVEVPAYDLLVSSKAPQGGEPRWHNKLIVGEKKQIDFDTTLLANALKRDLGDPALSQLRMSVGNELVRSGMINPRQYGAILQSVILDPQAKSSDKMQAMASNDSATIGAVMLALHQDDARLKLDIQLSPLERIREEGRNFGNTAADLEKSLSETASSDKNIDVRALAAAVLYASKRAAVDQEEGAQLMDGISRMYTSKKGSPEGSFAHEATIALQRQMTESASDDVKQRIYAAESLGFLNSKQNGDDSQKALTLVTKSLAESFDNADLSQKMRIINTLAPGGIKQLMSENPDLAKNVINSSLDLLQAPTRYSDAAEHYLIGLLQKMPALLEVADNDSKQKFIEKTKAILDSSLDTYSELRAAAVDTAMSLGSQDLLPSVRKLAVSDPYAEVRETALKSLDRLPDPQLKDLVHNQLAIETDATVSALLRDLNFKLQPPDRASEQYQSRALQARLNFEAAIKNRYPQLASFDQNAQSAWIKNNFPLLDHATFIKEVQDKVRNLQLGIFTNTSNARKTAADSVQELRQQEFSDLLALAQTDMSSTRNDNEREAIQQARLITQSIISSDGRNIAPPASSFPIAYTKDKQGHASPINYQESAHDWSLQAANTLSITANKGAGARDLSARLISMALVSNKNQAVKEVLVAAWKRVNEPDNGISPIAPELYNYVLDRATSRL